MEESRIKTNLIDWINNKDLPVKVIIISGIGRCLVATRNIAKEKGNSDKCPSCLEDIDEDDHLIDCNICHKPVYCNTKCKDENERYHNIICDNIQDIDHFVLDTRMYPGIDYLFDMKSKYGPDGLSNQSFQYDSAILKLVITILCYKYKEEHITNPNEIVSNFRFKHIMEGESHYDDLITNELTANALNYLGNVVLQLLPLTFYPGVIFINHSCLPNSVCCGKNNGKIIEFRAVTDIKIGEEITCSYVEECETREHRQDFLLNHYNFQCKCLRCLMPLSKSVDRFLNGYNCKDCKCELVVKEDDRNKYECIKCKKIYERKFLYSKYKKISEFYLVGRSIIKHHKEETINIFKQILDSNDILYLSPYHTKSMRITMIYLVLIMKTRSHKEFSIRWNKMVQCFNFILGREMLSLLSLYVMYVKEYIANLNEEGDSMPDDDISSILRIVEDGVRIARNCCGSNHKITEFIQPMSQAV